jgi:hypothetical protein
MHASSFLITLLAAAASAASVVGRMPAAADAAAAAGAVDFGKCKPTINFKLGRPGRKATEGTFLPDDPAIASGQQDALNPAIITNRVCDKIKDKAVCGGNAAAESKCLAAKAQADKGAKDATTAALFNKLVSQ